MNYNEFKKLVQKQPVIVTKDIVSRAGGQQALRNQIERWRSKGFLIKLKKGLLVLNEDDRRVNPSRQYIANRVYAPSYISLEYALSYYGIIPERTSDLTSIATRKTFRLANSLGVFSYQHVKTAAFRGFIAVKDEAGLNFFIAEPEKAIVDFLYFNMKNFKKGDFKKTFEESYRLQNLENLKIPKIMKLAGLFSSDKLTKMARALCAMIKREA